MSFFAAQDIMPGDTHTPMAIHAPMSSHAPMSNHAPMIDHSRIVHRPETLSGLSGLTPMSELIGCVARAFAASKFYEAAPNNADRWITDLWSCYHPYGNRGAYCVVGAWTIINTAFEIMAAKSGIICLHGFPTRPRDGSPNPERTLYGSVYRTYMEIVQGGTIPVGSEPEPGAVFFRASNDRGYNHAGIVLTANLRDDDYIQTVEANTTVSGGSGSPKGFVIVSYTRAAYDKYLVRSLVKSPDAARYYGNTDVKGWRFAYVGRNCSATSVPVVDGWQACLGIMITCGPTAAPPSAPPPPECDTAVPPAPRSDDGDYTAWNLLANDYPRSTDIGGGLRLTERKPDSAAIARGDIQVADSCWVRYRRDTVKSEGGLTPREAQTCKDTYVLMSACDSAGSGQGRTTLRIPSSGDILTPHDLSQQGAREALFSSVIPRDDYMGRGYAERYRQAFDAVPMVRLANANVFVLVQTSALYPIFEQLGLWGPNPHFLRIDRTAIEGGTGGGYAERLAQYFTNDSGKRLALRRTRVSDTAGLLGKRFPVEGVVMPGSSLPVDAYRLSFFDYLTAYEALGDTRPLVIVFTGEPIMGWDAIVGPLSVITGFIPGIGPVVSQAIGTIERIRQAQGTGADLAFALTSQIMTALGSGVLGDAPFGVPGSVFREIASTTTRAGRVYGTLKAVQGGSAVAAAVAVAGEFGRQFPEAVTAVGNEFRDAERWVRNAASEVERLWNNTLGDVRSAVHNVADGIANERMGGLIQITTGIDNVFSQLIASGTSLTTSVTQVPLVQELLTTKGDASLLAMVPGVNKIVGNILSNTLFYGTDVQSPTTHAALAGIATGKRVLDGALDALSLSALINKAEDFARKAWQFDLPMTIAPEKRECFAHEIRIVTGIECCAPKTRYCGVCYDPENIPDCPPGQGRDSDGCCVDRPVQESGSGGVSTGSGVAQPGSGGVQPGSGAPVGTGVIGRDSTTVPSVDVPTPARLPDCIHVRSGAYVYCPPPACSLRPGAGPRAPLTTPPEPQYEYMTTSSVTTTDRTPVIGVPLETLMRKPVGSDMYAWTPVAHRRSGDTTWYTLTSDVIQGTGLVPYVPAYMPQGAGSTPTVVAAESGACYEARYANAPFERWYANIGGAWTELIDCCPQREDDCCSETRTSLVAMARAIDDVRRLAQQTYDVTLGREAATEETDKVIRETNALVKETNTLVREGMLTTGEMQRDIVKLTELVRRAGAGEPIDLTDIRRDLAYLRSNLPQPTTRYDDTEVLRRLAVLHETVTSLCNAEGRNCSYDDSVLRRDIDDIRRLVEARCTPQGEVKNYDERFDIIEASIANLTALLRRPDSTQPSAGSTEPSMDTTGPTTTVAVVDTTPILREIQRAIAELRTASGSAYDDAFRRLTTAMTRVEERIAGTTARDTDGVREELVSLRMILERIEKATTANYDTQFAQIRTILDAMVRDGVTSYDERFTRLERLITDGMAREAGDYGERFHRLETLLGAIYERSAASASCDDTVRDYFTRIMQRLWELSPAQGGASTASDCSAGWDEALTILRELRTRSVEGTGEPDAMRDVLAELRRCTASASERDTTYADGRYAEIIRLLQLVMERLETNAGQNGDAPPVAAHDPRMNEALLLLRTLEGASRTMLSSLDRSGNDLQLLLTGHERMQAAFTRLITDMREELASHSGNEGLDLRKQLREAEADYAYQTARYNEEIAAVRARLQECMSRPSPRATGEDDSSNTWGARRGSMRGYTPIDRSPAPCPDCPAVIERHERAIYRYPEQYIPSVPVAPVTWGAMTHGSDGESEEDRCDDDDC